jgi:hypothetical protein
MPAVQGAFFWIDRNLLRVWDGTLDLDTMAIKAALLASSQVVSRSFTGGSGEARYADLTGELATANGYTAGGVALSSVAISRPAASTLKLTSAAITWTLTNTITFKYCALYVSGATNKEILAVCDMDTGGGSVSPGAGTLQFDPTATGWLTGSQP